MPNWGAFRPDVGGPNSGVADMANNVLPQTCAGGIGYGPMARLTVPAGATVLPAPPRGSIALRLFDGTQRVFYGTETTIQQLQSDFTWLEVASGLSVTVSDDQSFCHFGSYLLNTNTTDGFKAYNVEAPAGNNAVSGAPISRFIFSCNNVVFALDCDGNNKRMASSGLGDHTAWNRLGANGKSFEDGGALIWGADLKNGAAVIYQDDASRLIQFGGAPGGALYTIAKIADGRGSVGQRSCVSFDGMVFTLATDGFYKFTLGGGNEPIGAEKINRWFLGRVDQSRLAEVEGAVDPLNKMVWWRYPTLNINSDTVFDDLIGYDWQLNEWVTASVQASSLGRLSTPGYVLDAMDGFGPLDSIDIPLDSRFWQGGQPVFAALDEEYKFATFSGGAAGATLRSCVMNSPVTSLIGWATPISDAPNSTLAIGVADAVSDSITWKTPAAKVSAGRVPLRARGLNIQFEEAIPQDDTWFFANGVEHIRSAQGGPK